MNHPRVQISWSSSCVVLVLFLASIGSVTMPRRANGEPHPPCAHLAVLPESWLGQPLCLDDWILFNQQLWADVFADAPFDLENPLIEVDGRVGTWTTTTIREHGGQEATAVLVTSAPLSLVDALSEGLVTFSDFVHLLSADVTLHDVALSLTGQTGLASVRGLAIGHRVDAQTELVHLIPYQRYSLGGVGQNKESAFDRLPPHIAAAVEEFQATGLCVCPVCECEVYNLPPLSKEQNGMFCQRACEYISRHSDDISECASEWNSRNNRALLVGGIGVALLIFSAPPTAGMSFFGGGAVVFAAGVSTNAADATVERENCEQQADDLLVTQLNTQCELRCIDSSR